MINPASSPPNFVGRDRMAAMTAASSAVSRSAFFGAVAKENGLQKRVGACQAKLSMVTYHSSLCNFSIACSHSIDSWRTPHLNAAFVGHLHYPQMYVRCTFRGHICIWVSVRVLWRGHCMYVIYMCDSKTWPRNPFRSFQAWGDDEEQPRFHV